MTTRPARSVIRDPARAARCELPPEPLGLRLKVAALSELRQAQALLATPGDGRHMGVHQTRKCLRRTRAALALGDKGLGRQGRQLDEDLARLCRGLSPLRDAQALIEGLKRLETSASGPLASALPEMIKLAHRRRDERLASALARDHDFAHRRDRLQAMAMRLEVLDWPGVKRGAVAKSVARSQRRLAKSRRRAVRDPGDDERWHAMRRRLRRLRQQDHLLAVLEPDLRPTASVCAEEAAALGESQDDALLMRHCGARSPFPPVLRALLRAEARSRLGRARRARPPAAS